MKKLSAFASVVLIACGGETEPVTTGGDPPSGFYGLSITTTADTCTPARVQGNQGTVPVTMSASMINIPMLFVEGEAGRQDIPWSGRSIDDYSGCSGSKLDMVVASKSSDSLDIDVTERWVGAAACGGPSAAPFGVPSTDCTATRHFKFTLVERCPAVVDGQRCD